MKKTIFVTGTAGFIGSFLSAKLLELGYCVVGFDNMNNYYDSALKEYRLSKLTISSAFTFIKGDIADKTLLFDIFRQYKPTLVVHLAAQAGVRYSIVNPDVYIESNITGFFNILEACRHSKELCGIDVRHLIYASSSSVYGNQQKTPFSTDDDTSCPISLYAVTKKSNELLAYSYSHLYNIPTTGLRFFTVYGEAGRPDMAYFSFTDKLVKGETIKIFNNGNMRRDFTYVGDIVTGICDVIKADPPAGKDPACIYNIGNNKPEDLLHFVEVLEQCLIREGIIDKPGKKEFLPMQPGDVYQTYADIEPLARDFGFKPSTTIEEGLGRFAKWYREYYIDGKRKDGHE